MKDSDEFDKLLLALREDLEACGINLAECRGEYFLVQLNQDSNIWYSAISRTSFLSLQKDGCPMVPTNNDRESTNNLASNIVLH